MSESVLSPSSSPTDHRPPTTDHCPAEPGPKRTYTPRNGITDGMIRDFLMRTYLDRREAGLPEPTGREIRTLAPVDSSRVDTIRAAMRREGSLPPLPPRPGARYGPRPPAPRPASCRATPPGPAPARDPHRSTVREHLARERAIRSIRPPEEVPWPRPD